MNKIEKFKLFIRFIVSIFASREFAFVYCIIGTLAQTAHTYYLVESISSLEGWSKTFQAVGLSFFISSSLLFFTAIADNDKSSKDYKRIHLAVNLFMWIEIIINVYYYAAHLIIKPANGVDSNIFDFIFAILVSCLIPITIKLYAGIIQAKEWFESFSKNESNNQVTPSDYDSLISDKILEVLSNQKEIEKQWTTKYVGDSLLEFKTTFIEMFGKQIQEEFEKNQTLFLNQFENKCKTLLTKSKEPEIVEDKILTETIKGLEDELSEIL